MTIDVEAIYEDGVLKLTRPLKLPERAQVHVTIEIPEPARTPLGRRLLELRSEVAKSGATRLGWDEIEKEVTARRGGWREAR
jgi:predicted DNA-binding antitoxin AbrB/MazE fold protein